ncbi:CopG family transcriptional regulator [Novosphingobium album (ex Liu et al. 2023)]|nr:CopG family transcriptional regulator [Novosphingobium album (ex Liu et al. 2023)]
MNTAGSGSRFPCQAIGDGLKHPGAISTGPFSKGLVMTETVLISVRLPGPIAEAANAAAVSRNISRSKLLRIAIERFIDDISGSSEQDRRRQFSSEYTFLALDLIVQREYPEVHTELLTEAERRMEAFHGGA